MQGDDSLEWNTYTGKNNLHHFFKQILKSLEKSFRGATNATVIIHCFFFFFHILSDPTVWFPLFQGLCDNLLTCIIRAWDTSKPLFFCPAMNTRMYLHPLTASQILQLESWGYKQIPCISKTLMCGDTGIGAMAPVDVIVNDVVVSLSN